MWHSPSMKTKCFRINALVNNMPRRGQTFQDETNAIWEVFEKKNETLGPGAIKMSCHHLVIF